MRLLLIMMAIGCATASMAHQQKHSITNVLFNDRTEMVEVSHKFSLHDAEHAIKKIFKREQLAVVDDVVLKTFAQYVIDRFKLSLNGGEVVKLKQLGHESDGVYLWIYQEHPYKEIPEKLTIEFDALMEIWPKQLNLINVEYNSNTQSMELSQLKSSQEMTLTKISTD